MSKEKLLITGAAAGKLGSILVEILSSDYQVIPADVAEFDITNFEATRVFIHEKHPDVIIHTAAFTPVDDCEDQPDKAFKVNALGTRNVAISAKQINAKLFYISTDYVFDGTKDDLYYEYDRPNPINIYGKSKLLGEIFVKEQLNRFFIIRTAWLYGPRGKDFVEVMVKLAFKKEKIKIANDQCGTPTFMKDLVRQINKLLPTDLYGTYHCVNQGKCTWYQCVQVIFESISKITFNKKMPNLIPVKTKELPKLTKKRKSSLFIPGVTVQCGFAGTERPKNNALNNYMLKLENMDIMPHWEDSLQKFIKDSYSALIKELESKHKDS